MLVRLTSLLERLRASLFFVPMAFVIMGALAALAGVAIDERIDVDDAGLPLGLSSTVDSARVVLSTIAGATIGFAGIAFSVSLLLIQQASSQYSPRVVHGLFRDPFNKRVMGIVVGTFTYCLVLLRSVRSPVDATAAPTIPTLSVAVGVVLGLVTILAIVAFIDHSAHSMDVSKILGDVTDNARRHVARQWRPLEDWEAADEDRDVPEEADEGDMLVVLDRDGWIQHIDLDALAQSTPEGSTILLSVAVGRYAIPNTPLCSIRPAPADAERAAQRTRASVLIGPTRTMQQDVSYGVRQLVDVALKALSPGINDPTTAQDAIFHLGALLHELLIRCPPPRRQPMEGDRLILLPEGLTHRELVGLAFDEIRLAAADMPTVCIYLLEMIHLVERSLGDLAVDGVRAALHEQAALVRDGAGRATLDAHDRQRVQRAHATRFGPDARGSGA